LRSKSNITPTKIQLDMSSQSKLGMERFPNRFDSSPDSMPSLCRSLHQPVFYFKWILSSNFKNFDLNTTKICCDLYSRIILCIKIIQFHCQMFTNWHENELHLKSIFKPQIFCMKTWISPRPDYTDGQIWCQNKHN
jgi:hypothetical protein